ncbi:MAG: SUF system NifU family Fe-S cluster assembly protein [Candidatus Aenigmarchaeota archaeon]|nr:SUF system NifU family Fe-S cluster assembly protein [Candidatus Aenigmarchaeota archaeon]
MYDMYQENILDHYRNPRNFGALDAPDAAATDVNTLCGDKLGFHIRIADKTIADIKFMGQGCAISQASASMLTELALGKTIEEAAKLEKDEVFAMLGIPLSASRVKCALLSLKVLKVALYEYMGKKYDGD